MEISTTSHRKTTVSLGSCYEDTPNGSSLMLQKISINFIKHSMIVVVLLFFGLPLATAAFSGETITGEQEKTDFNEIKKKMENHYNNGRLEEVIKLYENECCIDKEPGREKKEFKWMYMGIKADIYHWAALSYVGLDQLEKGEICIKKLLELKRGKGTDSYWYSIRNTANEYYVAPRLLFGLKMGVNPTVIHLLKDYSGFIPLDESEKDSFVKDYGVDNSEDVRLGKLNMGIVVEYALTKNFSLSLQPSIFEHCFTYKNSFIRTEGNITHLQSYTHLHKLIYLDIPLLLKYRFLSKPGDIPYVQIGMCCKFLNEDPVRNIKYEEDGEYKNEVNIVTNRIFRNWGLSIWVGGGIAIDFRGIRLEYEMNFKFGINNITNEAMRYQNEILMFDYYDVLDDIVLSNWSMSIKVLMPIYFKAWKR